MTDTGDAPSSLKSAPLAETSPAAATEALLLSERQYRRLFEAARDGILLLDSDQGKITDANPFMTELLGYSRAELLGKELWEIGLLQDKDASQEAFEQLHRDGYIRYEDLPLENRSGARREVEFVSNLYREDGHTVIQCNIRDITERKRVAAELVAAAARHAHQDAVLEERTRMAREIHDTLAQGFAGIATQLEAAEAALTNLPEPAPPAMQAQLDKVQDRIGKARDLARESLAEARRSVEALRPPTLEATSLSEALALFLTQRALGTATTTRYILAGVPQELPDEIEYCLLRIGREAVANAVSHAQASEISMELSFEVGTGSKAIRLRVRDDGRGFDVGLAGTGRFGIIGMRERAEKVGGTLIITSVPGQGTDVSLTVPLPQNASTDRTGETL